MWCASPDLADVQLGALALICVVEAETLDALVQARGLRVEESRGTGATRRWGPRPRREERSGARGRRGVRVVHDEDCVLKHDCG